MGCTNMWFVNKERHQIYEIGFLWVCWQLTPGCSNKLCSWHPYLSQADSEEGECLWEAWEAGLDFSNRAVDREDWWQINNTESWGIRILKNSLKIGWQHSSGWKAPLEMVRVSPLLKQGQLEPVAQNHIQLGFKYLQGQRTPQALWASVWSPTQ